MFWAWEKHLAWREARREEGRRENQKATAAHLERVSKEMGIPLERLLPPQKEE